MRSACFSYLASVAILLIAGCPTAPYESRNKSEAAEPAPERATPVPQPRSDQPPEFVEAPADGDAAAYIASALETARAESRRTVVYVGAEWCEPCQYFHKALERGELDSQLAGVRFIEFDADRDSVRLAAAGYTGRYIPRFALPAADGSFGGQKIEGGVKGDGAVQHIMARLGPLLADDAS